MITTRSTTPFDPGNPNAPVGSEAWARAIRGSIQDALHDVSIGRESLDLQLKLLHETNGYQRLVDEQGYPFMLWEVFCSTRQPFGLGYDPAAIEAIVSERDTLQSVAKREKNNQRSRGRPAVNVDNIHIKQRPDGTSQPRALRRLRSQRPDLYNRVLADKLSPHAAMIEAGFRPRTFTVRADDPQKAASALARYFSPADRRVLIEFLQALP